MHNNASEYVVDRVNNNQSGARKCNHSEPVLHRWPCKQWVLMSYWQGHPVSSGGWCLIDHVDRVTLLAVGVDVLSATLTGSPSQQWGLMSYWPCWQGHPVSSGGWCLIAHADRVTLSAVGVDVLVIMLTGSTCRQWGLMSYKQGDPVSSRCSCHRILRVWVIIDGFE